MELRRSNRLNYKTSNFFTGFHHLAYLDSIQTSYSKSRHRKQSLPKLPYLAKKASSRFSQYAEIRRRKDYQITKEKDSNDEVTKTTSFELDPKETDDFAKNCNSAAEKLDVYVEEKILPKLQFLKKKAPSRFSQYEESQRGKDHYTNTNQKDKNKVDVVVIKDHTNETTFDQVLRDLEITSKEIKKGISENLNKNTASKTQHLDSSANVSSRLVQSMKTLIVQEKPSSLKENSVTWDESKSQIEIAETTAKFPRETKTAMMVLLNRSKTKPRNKDVVKQVETQTSTRTFATNSNLPCVKNLLCTKGFHTGSCDQNVTLSQIRI